MAECAYIRGGWKTELLACVAKSAPAAVTECVPDVLIWLTFIAVVRRGINVKG